MEKERSALLDAIYRSTKELHAEIDRYHALMVGVLTENVEPCHLDKLLSACQEPSVAKLKISITETIDVLEESRKAFKSRQLEMLRKKLMRVLFEADSTTLAAINHSKNERCEE